MPLLVVTGVNPFRISFLPLLGRSRDSSVGVRAPDRVKTFLQIVQTGSGIHSAFYPVGTGSSFHGSNATEHEADHFCRLSWTIPDADIRHKVFVCLFLLPEGPVSGLESATCFRFHIK
jgi:hypothetical protein